MSSISRRTDNAVRSNQMQNVVKDGILIVIMNSLFSLVSGLTVFSVLGFMAEQDHRCGTSHQAGPHSIPGLWV